MNAVAAGSRPGFFKRSWNALNSALAVGLILALLGLAFQAYQNRLAANQSANLQRISEFSADGASADRAVARFLTAAAEAESLDEPRRNAEQALVDHSIKVEQLRDVFGPQRADEYLQAIEQLQLEISRTRDATHNGPNETAFGRVIELRRSMVAQARAEA